VAAAASPAESVRFCCGEFFEEQHAFLRHSDGFVGYVSDPTVKATYPTFHRRGETGR
jgi:hypothetical protein